MTTSTLITVIVGLLVIAGSVLVTGVAGLLVWTARRMGDVSTVSADVDVLRTQIKNLDDFLESYRKRDAQRASTDSKRRKKATDNGDAETESAQVKEEYLRLFDGEPS